MNMFLQYAAKNDFKDVKFQEYMISKLKNKTKKYPRSP